MTTQINGLAFPQSLFEGTRGNANRYMNALQHSLGNMEPISLADMDSCKLLNRIDTKYVISVSDLLCLLNTVTATYRVLCVEEVRLSPYRTLYFDTDGYECYLQHHNGKLNRSKYRIREYLASGECFLEIKAKNNKGRTKKRRISIGQIEEHLSDTSEDFIASVAGYLPHLEPKLWTVFSRITLVSRTQPERVTLDLQLEFSDGSVRKAMPDLVVVEVKQERRENSSPVKDYLRGLRIHPMRVSKYCLGTALLKPDLKSNRFKSKLRNIQKIA